MILTGHDIVRARAVGDLTLEPFDSDCVQPNSYDLHLGDRLLTYDEAVLDARKDNPYTIHRIGPDGFLVQPDRVVLGHTVERVGSAVYVPILKARSTTARLGLFVHMTSDLIDLGSVGQLTLQLHAVQPLRVYAGMRLAQVTFWGTQGERMLYAGKYQGSKGPVASKSFQDGP